MRRTTDRQAIGQLIRREIVRQFGKTEMASVPPYRSPYHLRRALSTNYIIGKEQHHLNLKRIEFLHQLKLTAHIPHHILSHVSRQQIWHRIEPLVRGEGQVISCMQEMT